MRQAFEKHMLRLNPCTRLARQKTDGTYRTIAVQRAWELWQAASLPENVVTRVKIAGDQLSNCAFNLGQQAGRVLDEGVAKSLWDCSKAWDRARTDLAIAESGGIDLPPPPAEKE